MTDMGQREADLTLLNELLKEHPDELNDVETEMLASMRFDLTAYDNGMFLQLTEKQRAMVAGVHERIVGKPLTRLTAGEIPRGREVPTPAVLQNLPKKPLPLPKSNGPARVSRRHCGREGEGCYAFVNGDCTCGCCT
jgi:hypothetical protein